MELFGTVADKQQLAITDLTGQRSWHQLEVNILELVDFLQQDMNLKPGDHIALQMSNRVEFIEAMLAGIAAGLWVTPINTHLSQQECGYVLENCQAKLLLHDNDNSLLIPYIDERGLGCVAHEIELIVANTAGREDRKLNPLPDDSPAGGTMLYTSGTTGRPKGVMRHKPAGLIDALEKMRAGGAMFGLKGRGPHLVTGPLYHAAPMLFALYDLLNGAPMIIMPRWDSELFLALVADYQVVTTHLVPTMMVRLLRHQQAHQQTTDLSSLQLVLHGAAPIAKSTKIEMLDWWGDILVEYWGGSEAGITTLVTAEEWRRYPGTVGKPLPHFEVFVGDESGRPTGEKEGILYCRHRDLKEVFSYFNDPEKTRQAHPREHVFCIGDMGYLNHDGYVFLSDRVSNMIISGGVNIYPAEIEQVLMEHPSVVDCAVLGMPNEEWGEEVWAVVQPASGGDTKPTVTENQLIRFLRERIARYKVPRKIILVERLPRMPTGKIALRDLKQQLKHTCQPEIQPEI